LRRIPRMRMSGRVACLPAVFLLLVSCDPLTGRDAARVTRVSSGAGIGVVYVLCPSTDVRAVTLYRAREERPDYDPEDVLWKITSRVGSNRGSYVVGVTPPGFVEDVPLTTHLEPAQGLAITVDVDGDIGADVVFVIQDLREHQLLRTGVRGVQYFDPDEFRAEHLERCNP
jgi:hypothetical protein